VVPLTPETRCAPRPIRSVLLARSGQSYGVRVFTVLALLLSGGLLRSQTATVKLEDPAVIASGSKIFSTTCSVGYCHGKEGKAGRGPRLAGRKLDQNYVFNTVSNGINKSLMPSFKNQLTPDQIWSVVAYILTLSGDSPAPGEPRESVKAAPEPAGPAHPATVAPAAKSSDPNAGDPAAGQVLFFDASNTKHCASCHSFQGRGGDVGPDLARAAAKSPKEILQDILDPDATLAAPIVTVVMKSGEKITGVQKQDAPDRIRLYDASSLPPVLRTIYKDQIQTVSPETHSPMPHDYGKVLTRKQLLDLVSFLKSSPVSPQQIE